VRYIIDLFLKGFNSDSTFGFRCRNLSVQELQMIVESFDCVVLEQSRAEQWAASETFFLQEVAGGEGRIQESLSFRWIVAV
jgi:hypothetical protein